MDIALPSEFVEQEMSPNETALAWDKMAKSLERDRNGEIIEKLPEAKVIDFEASRQMLDQEAQQEEDNRELSGFVEEMDLSPTAYWALLRQEYAKEGVNIGFKPDTKELEKEITEFFYKMGVSEASLEREHVALRVEMSRMADMKAAEILRQQKDGRGLPVTFENDWLESGKHDIGQLLGRYYGDGEESKFKAAEIQSPEMRIDEWVGWKIAVTPSKPGDLNVELLFEKTPWREGEENGAEYYRRILNYSKQGPVRDMQLAQDEVRAQKQAEKELIERRKKEEAQRAEAEEAKLEEVKQSLKEEDLPILLALIENAKDGLKEAEEKGDVESQMNWEQLLDRLDEFVVAAKANTAVQAYEKETAHQPVNEGWMRDALALEMTRSRGIFSGKRTEKALEKLIEQRDAFEKQYIEARKRKERLAIWQYKDYTDMTNRAIRALRREIERQGLEEEEAEEANAARIEDKAES